LEVKLHEAKGILTRYDGEGMLFSFEQFEADLKQKEKVSITSLNEYYSEQIKLLNEQERVGLAGLYKENQRILIKFKAEALITDVNVRFLESFEYWLRNKRNNKDTTISVKMRNLQRVINQSIEDKLFKQENYPFGEKKYSINKRLDHTTKKIAISTDKIIKLKRLILKPGTALHLAQQLFLFSYYMRGMNFIDITYLKWEQISETHIDYRRTKTRGLFHLPRNTQANEILAYFQDNHINKHGFVFPVLDLSIHVTKQQQYTRKKTALKSVNDNLKKLAKMIGEVNLKLSTNVGRHSYATGLKRSGATLSCIINLPLRTIGALIITN
jgi:integrase/recombinase XerD